MKTLSRSAGIALLAIAVCVSSAGATTQKCQRTIAKASSQFVQSKVKALSKCEAAGIKAGVAATCPDVKASDSIAKATTKLSASIGKACGGVDKICGGDFTDEDLPATLGWPAECPNFERGTCTNTIVDCDGIATCLACLGEASVDQAIDLYYEDLALPSTGDLNKCQTSIGKATAAFLGAKTKALQKCWDARLNLKHSNPCDGVNAGDGKYLAAIAKAETKKVATICKACGGADKACGGGDDFTPAQIGFASTCPAVTVPGGAACGGPITDLQSIVDCVDCVTEFKVDCVDRAQVPQFIGYPSECGVCVAPDLSGTCPTSLTFTANGPEVDLDTGFTGLAHDAHVPSNGRLTLSISGCANPSHPCGTCSVNGPLPNAGGVTFNNRRCQDQPWVQCSVDGDCITAGATGPCIFFFGSPLPLVAGGVSTCVVNEIAGAVSGTVDVEAGASTTNVPLKSKVHPTGTIEHPCPICDNLCLGGGDPFSKCSSDADCPGSTCSPATICGDGPRLGQACSAQGTSQFGDVSLDCPPNPGSNAGTLSIELDISTATQTRTLSALQPNCRQTGFTSLKCFCDTCNNANQEACTENADCPISGGNPGICGGRRCIGGTNAGAPCALVSECPGGGQCNRPGEPTRPNVCLDDTTTGPVEACVDLGDNEGECVIGPTDQVCSVDKFRTCTSDANCQPPPFGTCDNCTLTSPLQTCINQQRPCFVDNGIIGQSVSVSGNADVPCGNTANPTVGTFFCVAPVGSTAVNAAGGLPALGRVRIPGTVVVSP
jgi:hypothetical protein